MRTAREYAARQPRRLRSWAEEVPPGVYDTVIALAVTAISLLLGHDHVPAGWHGLDTRGTLLTCVVNLPLAARRKAPVALCLTVFAVWTLYVALDYWPVVNSMGALFALYTVAAARPLRHALACGLLLAAVWNFAGTTGEESAWPTVLGQSVVYVAVLCGFGHLARESARRGDRLAELAGQLRGERAAAERRAADRAVAEERVRIARELHDVVAHHVSVISVQAGLAGYVFGSDPPTSRAAIETISQTSGEALAELRRLLAVLRVDDAPGAPDAVGPGAGEETADAAYVPAPGLARLGALAERVRRAGVPVELACTGEERDLPPGVEQCAYRVVQEALTNVLKHAGTTRTRVAVARGSRGLTVTVTNEPPPGAAAPAAAPAAAAPEAAGTGSGHGLMGMRERARIYGGSVTAGPRPDGGYEVRLSLPA